MVVHGPLPFRPSPRLTAAMLGAFMGVSEAPRPQVRDTGHGQRPRFARLAVIVGGNAISQLTVRLRPLPLHSRGNPSRWASRGRWALWLSHNP